MAANTTTISPPNLDQSIERLGFKPVDPFRLLNEITGTFGTVIQVFFAWVYFLSEIAVLAGAIVYMVGAIGHHSRIKRAGAHMVLYAILGFIAAVILPGVIVAINQHFHG